MVTQRSIWSIGLTFAAERPQISTFRRRNPLELETPKTARVQNDPNGVPLELRHKLGADRAPGRQIGFWSNQPGPCSVLRPPLLGRSIPLFFFKARVRQQMLQPRAIQGWSHPPTLTSLTRQSSRIFRIFLVRGVAACSRHQHCSGIRGSGSS